MKRSLALLFSLFALLSIAVAKPLPVTPGDEEELAKPEIGPPRVIVIWDYQRCEDVRNWQRQDDMYNGEQWWCVIRYGKQCCAYNWKAIYPMYVYETLPPYMTSQQFGDQMVHTAASLVGEVLPNDLPLPNVVVITEP